MLIISGFILLIVGLSVYFFGKEQEKKNNLTEKV
jgi:uncharacterized membrane protein